MKPSESSEDFANPFLHLCFEFHEEDTYWDFFNQKFELSVHISFHSEYEYLDVSSSPTLVNHETPLILEEKPTIPFVLVLLLFQFRCGCLLTMTPKLGNMKIRLPNYLFNLHMFLMIQIQWRKHWNGSWSLPKKVNSSTPQDDTRNLNLNPESCSTESITSLRDMCHPLSSKFQEFCIMICLINLLDQLVV